ncbi:hypothetical protein RMATCC62417_08705 [Rhizopus microsporus]|nr:hypothetical protein RMATCC62417_08705 [Rhizopus microsporus]
MTHRPVNTIKAYSAKQEEWKKWCLEQRFGDGEIVTDQKLSYFLAEYVMKRGRKLRRNPDGTPIALGRESVLAYVKAIADIYSKMIILLSQQIVANFFQLLFGVAVIQCIFSSTFKVLPLTLDLFFFESIQKSPNEGSSCWAMGI